MKRFILFALAYSFSVFALPLSLSAQDSDSNFPNYVVIGAFAHEKNAISFTDEAKHNKYTARYEMNPNRNLYYVYVLTTDDREYARAEALRFRAETKYFDAWVYSGVFGNIDVATIGVGVEQHDFNPVTGQRLENLSAGEQQRSTAQEGIMADATSNEGQTTVTGNRLVRNDAGQLRNNLTTTQDRSDQQRALTRNEGTTRSKNGEERSDVAAADESLIQQGDGVQQAVSGSTRVAQQQQQSSARSNPSERQTNLANQRQGATAALNGVEKQHVDGNAERDDETAVVSDDALQNNNTSQRQVATTKSVMRTTVQQGAETSQKSQKQEPGIAGDPERQESTTDETSATVSDKNSARATASKTQQASGRSEPKFQTPGGPDEADASTETDDGNISETVSIPAPVRQSTAQLTSEEVVGKNFYFHLYRADNQKTVPGEVDAIDFEKSRKMGTYPANERVKVTMAGGKMKHISFVCQIFGYRKQQQEFDPESPSEQLYLDDKGNLVVPFELVRLQKGDIAIMYNVFFFKDAAVMRPESRYEVNNLLDLLVENPSYKIMIHGHTNGNASGKIIRMDKPGNFYSLSGTKQGFGSAKQLSEERAIVIRDFLISSGISADRMQVKAWGGKKPIHDKHSVRAQENVRVEIEILSQ